MSTTGATTADNEPALPAIKAGNIKQAQDAIKKLQATDNINAVGANLIIFPNMTLWLAFLSNQAIQSKISEKHLREMYSTLTTQCEMSTSSPLAPEALRRLNVIKTQLIARAGSDEKQFVKACQWEDIDTQVGIMGRINEASADSKIFSILLKSTNIALWQSFIGNRSVTTRLTKVQREQLIQPLQTFASDPQDQRVWAELLATYAIKLFPANYMEKISLVDAQKHSQRFALLLDFSITKINEHVEKKDNIETIRWLQFVLKLAEHAPTLGLLRAHNSFIDQPPFDLSILSSSLTLQVLNVFPNYLSAVLRIIYRSVQTHATQKSHRDYREAVSLIRLLNNNPAFAVVVKADPTCRELLGISPITDIAPPIHVPAAPAVVIASSRLVNTNQDDDSDNDMTDVDLDEAAPLLPIRSAPPPSTLFEQPDPEEIGCLDRLFAPCLALFRSSSKARSASGARANVARDPITLYNTMR